MTTHIQRMAIEYFDCTYCKVDRGRMCHTPNGRVKMIPHASRVAQCIREWDKAQRAYEGFMEDDDFEFHLRLKGF